jgi:SAM-dependent methyltransferase/ribosomal protein S27E
MSFPIESELSSEVPPRAVKGEVLLKPRNPGRFSIGMHSLSRQERLTAEMESRTETRESFETDSAVRFMALTARCPDCHAQPLIFGKGKVSCSFCQADFPLSKRVPVLIRHDNAIFPLESYFALRRQAAKPRAALSRLVPAPSVNLSFKRSLLAFREELGKFGQSYVLVVGSGKQREKLESFFPRSGKTTLVCCDVDLNAVVDLFCDGHDLPFGNGVFQGVIATAVLQHVLCPKRVASEMFRVLSSGGVIYSEVAFMQQVCEGAYDYTRYSLSGHRVLLKNFRELSAGVVAGSGTSLVWAMENFFLSFFRSQWSRSVTKAVVRLSMFWVKYFDYLLQNKPATIDAASCTYFLGIKNCAGGTSEQEIVNSYVGQKNLRHT